MIRSYITKRSLTRALAVFIAVIVGHSYSLSEPFWITITAILVMQTAVGVTLRQGVERFVAIVFSVAMGTLLAIFVKQIVLLDFLIIVLFTFCCYLAARDSTRYFMLTAPFLLGTTFLVVMLLPAQSGDVMYARLYDVSMGAIIGILTNLVIFPTRADDEFRNNVIPVLKAYSSYLTAIIELLFQHNNENAETQQVLVEDTLQTQSAFFPVWVYERGFSYALRPGHRHFLVMTERVAQILYSMHHIARHKFEPEFLKQFHDTVYNYLRQANNIFQALTQVLNLNKLTEGVSDLNEELIALEKKFLEVVPVSLELLDLSNDYVYFAALIADLKDLRASLVSLGQALR